MIIYSYVNLNIEFEPMGFQLCALTIGGGELSGKGSGGMPRAKPNLYLCTQANSVTGAHTDLALLAASLGLLGSGPGYSLSLTKGF